MWVGRSSNLQMLSLLFSCFCLSHCNHSIIVTQHKKVNNIWNFMDMRIWIFINYTVRRFALVRQKCVTATSNNEFLKYLLSALPVILQHIFQQYVAKHKHNSKKGYKIFHPFMLRIISSRNEFFHTFDSTIFNRKACFFTTTHM